LSHARRCSTHRQTVREDGSGSVSVQMVAQVSAVEQRPVATERVSRHMTNRMRARLPLHLLLPPHTGFPMSAHLSRLRLFQRHLRSMVWVGVWIWDWIHSHTPPCTRSHSSRHPPFTHYPCPPRSLVCGGQPSPHKPRLVVSHSTCPPLSSSPRAQLCIRYCSNKQQRGPPTTGSISMNIFGRENRDHIAHRQ
jgi:hypothetical protein